MPIRHPRAPRRAVACLLLTAALALGAGAATAQGPDACATLQGRTIDAGAIGLPTQGAAVTSAQWIDAAEPLPAYCEVRAAIAPVDPAAPPIQMQLNLPAAWNGKAMHFGGGGFNGSVVSGLGAAPSAPPDVPRPLARGYATFGSDSGHTGGNASFALNEEALINYGHAQLKKTRDVAVALIDAYFGDAPAYTYFVGSSTGGREGVTVAQRYPQDYDGVFSRVPVLNFSGLQIAGNRAGGAPLLDGGWLNPTKVQLVHNATLAACDGLDGAADGIVSKYESCRFDPATLRCPGGTDTGDTCLSDRQIAALQLLRSPLEFDFPLANGVRRYPGWGYGGEGHPGGFGTWFTGAAPPADPPPPGVIPGIGIYPFGNQFIRYFIAQDPTLDTFGFDPNAWQQRIQQVSAHLDATDPDLTAFARRGGKLILNEFTGDYAQSPFAGIEYFKAVRRHMGPLRTNRFARLYVTPGADHGGGNVPSAIDFVQVLEDWAERGVAPHDLVQTQYEPGTTTVLRARPLCRYPAYPRYRGHGDPNRAESFRCVPQLAR